MKSEIKAEEVSVGKLFSPDFRFNIPIYQRPLSWGKDNFDQLVSQVKEDQKAIALVPLDQIPFVLKIVKVEGVDVLDKNTDLNNYALNLNIWLGVKKNSDLAFALESWPGFDSNYERTELIAVGDMMLSRFVGTMMKRKGDCAWPYRPLPCYSPGRCLSSPANQP